MAGCEIFINMPSMFSVVWSSISHFLSEGFTSKIQFFPEGSLDAQKLMLDRVSARALPREFGGVASPILGGDENTDCVIPVQRKRSSLRGHTGLAFKCKADLERHYHPQINIPAGRLHELPIEVDGPGDCVAWDWRLEAHSIKFAVTFTPAGQQQNSVEEVVAERSVPADQPEIGRFVADKEGVVVLRFDNTFSRLRGKTVTYGQMAYHAAAAPATPEEVRAEHETRHRGARTGSGEGDKEVTSNSA